MSTLSDLLTTGSTPWWGAIVGTLAGAGLNNWYTAIRDKRRDQVEDRRRWEIEVRDRCVEIDRQVETIIVNCPDQVGGADDYQQLNSQAFAAPYEKISDEVQFLRYISPAKLLEAAGAVQDAADQANTAGVVRS